VIADELMADKLVDSQ